MLKFITCIMLIFSTLVYGHINLDSQSVANIRFEVIRSFDVVNARTGRPHKIYPRGNVKVRVVGKNRWAYKIKIEVNGEEKPGTFLATKKWVKRALNFQAARNAIRLQAAIQNATDAPQGDCGENREPTNVQNSEPTDEDQIDSDNSIEVIAAEDLFEDPEPAVSTSNTEWKPGCEVLADRASLNAANPEQKASLKKCIKSIQNAVTRNGTITSRGTIFRNLYKYLKPEEQHFAAMIFTSHGEAAVLVQDANGQNVEHHEELMMIMKVVNNRVRNSNRVRRGRRSNMNALDIALDPWQFSMYNANSNGWKKMVQPGYGVNFSNAITAYMKFNTANFQPDPEVDHVYHYHANYVLPSDSAWGRGFRANNKRWELQVSVNGDTTRESNPSYDENSSSDRSRIGRNWRLWRHRFYLPIDTQGQVTSGDNWYWSVRRPFRS
ncbi:MAG: hypothetical protein KC493_08400 [Bacteriovoracaceae bacterium]|nr:hypothetical protein [Bacteriovoracaceae bacterium]